MARKRKETPLLEGIIISDVAAEGKAIAKIERVDRPGEQFVVFIPYGAPGDVADVKIDRKKHSFAEGHIERLVKASELRVEPKCAHFGVCGGCKWQHLGYQEQLAFKRRQVEDALRRIAKVDFPDVLPTIGSEREWCYRNKMEYTFADKRWRTWEEVRSGIDFEGSHNALGFHIPGAFDKVLHIDCCYLQADLGNRIRNALFTFADNSGFSFYNLRENRGFMRSMMIRIASTGEVMVCLQFGEERRDDIEQTMRMLAERFPEITSLLYVVNLKANDTIGDQKIHVYRGRDYIVEQMEGLKFRINAKSFYQTNSEQAYRLYSVVREMAGLDAVSGDEAPVVYDLYTGTGTIANFVARAAAKVIGIEYVPEAIEDAKLNSQANGISNTLFYAGDMKDVLTPQFIAANGKPDVIIADPPRAGMHPDVIDVIMASEAPVIVYVSCNPATQARDLALFDEKYVVERVQPVDMFPHTHHVENVVKLRCR